MTTSYAKEAASYSLLKPYQRSKAGQFFGALGYAALGEGHPQLREHDFAQHRFWDHPRRYGGPSASFSSSP